MLFNMNPVTNVNIPKTLKALQEFEECRSRATIRVVKDSEESYLQVVTGFTAYSQIFKNNDEYAKEVSNFFSSNKNIIEKIDARHISKLIGFLGKNRDYTTKRVVENLFSHGAKNALEGDDKSLVIKLITVFSKTLQFSKMYNFPSVMHNQGLLTHEELSDLALKAAQQNNKVLFKWTVKLMGGKSTLKWELVKEAIKHNIMKLSPLLIKGSRCPSHLLHHFICTEDILLPVKNYSLHDAINNNERVSFTTDDTLFFPDLDGNTPLMLAIQKESVSSIPVLLSHDTRIVMMYNSLGASPFHLLLETENESIWGFFDYREMPKLKMYQSCLLPMLIQKDREGKSFVEGLLESDDRRLKGVLRLLVHCINLKPSGLRLLLKSFSSEERKKDFIKLISRLPELFLIYLETEGSNFFTDEEIYSLAIEQKNAGAINWLAKKASSSEVCMQLILNHFSTIVKSLDLGDIADTIDLFIQSQGVEKYLDLVLHHQCFNSHMSCLVGFFTPYMNYSEQSAEFQKRLPQIVKLRQLRNFLADRYVDFKEFFPTSPAEIVEFAVKNDFPELLKVLPLDECNISLPMLRLPNFCRYLRENHTSKLEEYIRNFGALKELDRESKLALLGYLPAEDIWSTIKNLSHSQKRTLIDVSLDIEEAFILDNDGNVQDIDFDRTLPLPEALNYLRWHRLRKIPAATEQGSPLMVAELKNNLDKIPLDSLAYLASSSEHREVVLTFIKYFEELQLKVIVPQIRAKGLMALLKNSANGELHARLLKFATDAQKTAYLNEYPLDKQHYTDWKKMAGEFAAKLVAIESLPVDPARDKKIVNLQTDFQEYTKNIQMLEGYSVRLKRIGDAIGESTSNREVLFRVSNMLKNMKRDLGSFLEGKVGEIKKDYDSLKKIYDLELSGSDAHPPEFLDPILGEVMTEPLICPNTQDIVDRSSLALQVNNPRDCYMNPYDRKAYPISAYKLDTALLKRIAIWKARKNASSQMPIEEEFQNLESSQPSTSIKVWINQQISKFYRS